MTSGIPETPGDGDFDDLLALARAHLSRIEATGDPSLTLDPGVSADTERLDAYTRTPDGSANLDALFVHGWLRWHRHVADPLSAGGAIGYVAALTDLTYCFVVGMTPLPEPLLAAFARRARAGEDELRKRAEELSQRAQASGDRERIAAAIDLWQLMIAPDHPVHPEDLPMSWSNLGFLRYARYELDGDSADLDAAIRAYERAVELEPPDNAERARYQSNLSGALYQRAMITNSARDREEALALGQIASERSRPGDTDRVKYLSNAGINRLRSYDQSGGEADLSAAITAFDEALSGCGPDDPDRAGVLSNLGNALLRRSELTGSTADLERSVRAHRDAVAATLASDPNRAKRLSNLSTVLRSSFARMNRDADLDESVETAREALSLLGRLSPDRPAALFGLGGALQARFIRGGARDDLDEAIELVREAAGEASASHADHALFIGNLGVFLMLRYESTGAVADLDAAIDMGRSAVAAAPAGYVHRAALLSFLGSALSDRAGLPEPPPGLSRKELLILARKMYLLAASTESATPTVRIDAMREAASLGMMPLSLASLSIRKRIKDTAALLENAVLLLPEVAPRQLSRTDQQRQIGGFAGLASDAAAYALADVRRGQSRAQRAARAISLLEHGRGIMLSQALGTRGDLTELRRLRPDLARQYERLRDLLDRPASGEAAGLPSGPSGWAASVTGPDRTQLARDFEVTVAEIRRVEGLGGFMLPPPLPELADAAGSGAVVFNVGSLRSDAILLKSSGDIDYVPLPLLTIEALAEKIELFHAAQEMRMGWPPTKNAAEDADRTLLEILEWLWDAAAGPALDALGFDGTPNPWGLYEVKWVPGGLLGQLPIHAAGRHRSALNSDGSLVVSPDGRQPPTVMDRAISSYAPTVRALHNTHTRSMARRRERPARSLIVAMPVTSQPEALSSVSDTVRYLHATLPGANVLMPVPYLDKIDASIVSGEPSRAEVVERLKDCQIAHFVCHGITDPVDPSRSKLLLSANQRTDPLTVADLTPVRLDEARLAYLSACSTARNEVAELADESIHVASAFQLAGFPHVIGTLWEVDVGVAGIIAREFYQRISADHGFPNVNEAARVLHAIMRDLRRDVPQSPFTWAGYLHVGP